MLFVNRVSADAIKLRWRSYWISTGPKSNDWCPCRKREIWTQKHTEGKRPREGGSRDWSYGATSQEHLGPPEAGGGEESAMGGSGPCPCLGWRDLDVQTSSYELDENLMWGMLTVVNNIESCYESRF